MSGKEAVALAMCLGALGGLLLAWLIDRILTAARWERRRKQK